MLKAQHSDLTEIHGKSPKCFSKGSFQLISVFTPTDRSQPTITTLMGKNNITPLEERQSFMINVYSQSKNWELKKSSTPTIRNANFLQSLCVVTNCHRSGYKITAPWLHPSGERVEKKSLLCLVKLHWAEIRLECSAKLSSVFRQNKIKQKCIPSIELWNVFIYLFIHTRYIPSPMESLLILCNLLI